MAQGSAASILAAANSGAVRGNRGYSAPGTLARHKPWGICINLSWLCLGYIIGVCVTMYMSFKAYTPAWIDQPVGQRSSALPQTLSEHRTPSSHRMRGCVCGTSASSAARTGFCHRACACRKRAGERDLDRTPGGSTGCQNVPGQRLGRCGPRCGCPRLRGYPGQCRESDRHRRGGTA